MKANPAHGNGTGRKKRATTLPGTGISTKEKARRLTPMRHLTKVMRDEPQLQTHHFNVIPTVTYGEHTIIQKAHQKLDKLSTATLEKLVEAYPTFHEGVGLKELLVNVMDNPRWRRTFRHHLEDVIFDVAAYRHVFGTDVDLSYNTSLPDNFKTLYDLTGFAIGSLPKLGDAERVSVEALMLVISKNGRFTGHTFTNKVMVIDYFSLPVPDKEFPVDLAQRIMEHPEHAEALVEYMNRNFLQASAVDWDEFMNEYVSIAAPFREGVL